MIYGLVHTKHGSYSIRFGVIIFNGKILVSCLSAGSSVPVKTIIEHDSQGLIMVNGFEAPDYYVRSINYATNLAGLTEVIERAVSCEQRIKYQCQNSKLMEIYSGKLLICM